MRKLEFVEISPKNKDKLLDKYKTSFEKDQKKYDKLFEYEAKKVVHYREGPEAKPPPSPPPSPPSPPSVPCSLDMGSSWLYGFV